VREQYYTFIRARRERRYIFIFLFFALFSAIFRIKIHTHARAYHSKKLYILNPFKRLKERRQPLGILYIYVCVVYTHITVGYIYYNIIVRAFTHIRHTHTHTYIRIAYGYIILRIIIYGSAVENVVGNVIAEQIEVCVSSGLYYGRLKEIFFYTLATRFERTMPVPLTLYTSYIYVCIPAILLSGFVRSGCHYERSRRRLVRTFKSFERRVLYNDV